MNYHLKSSVIQMNEPWSIPRASLGSIGGSQTSQKSNSNPSSVKVHIKKQRSHTNNGYNNSEGGSSDSASGSEHEKKTRPPSKTLEELQNKFDEFSSRNKNINNRKIRNDENHVVNPKRGSRSSQGSTDSNHSSHSASSGSLLLTAANLERFTHIHKKNLNETNHMDHLNYKKNITLSSLQEQNHHQSQQKGKNEFECNETSIQIDPNLLHPSLKTKDMDTMSMASSTHFTVVNGMGGPQRSSNSSGLCSRGHQITVLIVSMSMVFLIGIMGAIYYLEMRAREMPH